MKSIKDEKNFILPRRELMFEVEHTTKPTPSRSSIGEEVSKNIKCNKDLIVIKNINTNYGSAKSHVKVYVYDNKDEMKLLERIKEPKKEAPDAKIEEKASEEPKKEAPDAKIEEK